MLMNTPLRTNSGASRRLRVPMKEYKLGPKEIFKEKIIPSARAMSPSPPKANQRLREIPGMRSTSKELVTGYLLRSLRTVRIMVISGGRAFGVLLGLSQGPVGQQTPMPSGPHLGH